MGLFGLISLDFSIPKTSDIPFIYCTCLVSAFLHKSTCTCPVYVTMHIICSMQYAFISWVNHVQSYVGHTLKTFWRHFDVLTASVDNVAPQVRRHDKFQRACHACCVQLESRPWAADIFSIPKLRRGMAIDLADGSFQCRWNVCEAKPILASHLWINHVDPVPSSGARFRPVEVGCFRHLFCRLGRCSKWYH